VHNLKAVTDSPGSANALEIESHLAARREALLEHRYFRLCRTGELGRAQLIDVVKQLYCFSVFFERLLTLRIGRYTSDMDGRVLKAARQHLREEIGHAELFQRCLIGNGVSQAEMTAVMPKMFTKALFGYLLATVLHENEYVANVAIMQVMEGIGLSFFRATLGVMRAHRMLTTVMQRHSEDDEEHSKIGLELAGDFDRATMFGCHQVIDDLYRLMGHVLDEWLTPVEGGFQRAAR
jgi:hypothetical protein